MKIIAVKTIEEIIFFYQKESVVISNVEIKLDLFTPNVTNVELNCLLFPIQANILVEWGVFSRILPLTKNFEELRLRLKLKPQYYEILSSELVKYPKINPVEIMLCAKNKSTEFIFRDLESYDYVFSVVVTPNSEKEEDWPFSEWYIPDDSLT